MERYCSVLFLRGSFSRTASLVRFSVRNAHERGGITDILSAIVEGGGIFRTGGRRFHVRRTWCGRGPTTPNSARRRPNGVRQRRRRTRRHRVLTQTDQARKSNEAFQDPITPVVGLGSGTGIRVWAYARRETLAGRRASRISLLAP